MTRTQRGSETFQEPTVQRSGHRIYVRDYPGAGPPILLLHAFPDNLPLSDRLVPHLPPTRRVVTFDFLGWGRSDKPASYRPTARNQLREVETVIDQLGLEDPVLVVHDASGPPPRRPRALPVCPPPGGGGRSPERPPADPTASTGGSTPGRSADSSA